MKKLLEKTAAFAAGAVILALCLEISLRILGSQYTVELPRLKKRAAFTILCVGDSFTHGAGAPRSSSYPVQLEKILRARFPDRTIRVINFGESAQNTAQLVQRLPEALDSINPDAVVLLSGMANFWNYWGYRDGIAPPRRKFLDRVRIARLAKLLWREAARGPRENLEFGRPAAPPETFNSPQHTLCMQKLASKDLQSMVAACSAAVEESPRDVNALLNIGFAYLDAGRPAEAMKWLSKAVNADPTNMFAYSGISNALGPNRREAEKWMKIGAVRSGGGTRSLFSGKLDIPEWIALDIDRAIGLVKARNIKLMMQNYPTTDRPEFILVSSLLNDLAAARGVPFVDQAGEFDRLVRQGLRDEYFAPRDPHCSARGYGLMARRLADAMENNKFITRYAR